MENQAEYYYEKLEKSTNPGQVMLDFFRDVTGKEAGRSEIIMLNRLISMFGRFTVYFSVLDLGRYEKLDGNLHPLLFTICKNRFERIHSESFTPSHESLTKTIDQLLKDADKAKRFKGKLPDSEGL